MRPPFREFLLPAAILSPAGFSGPDTNAVGAGIENLQVDLVAGAVLYLGVKREVSWPERMISRSVVFI